MTAAGFWDGVAEKYAASPVRNEAAYAETLDRVRARLTPDDRVLEIGCGTGTTALKLADAVAHITATDISEKMIEIARGKAADQGIETVEFVQAAPGDGRLPQGPFDAVTAFNLIHLLPDAPAALAEIHGLLKPGSLFISKTPCLSGPWRALWVVVAAMRLVGKAPAVRFLSPKRLERWIEAAGFEILETGDYPKSPPSRFVVARRL